jgi:4-hydroxythreonine-4-phosphate dehydrogenase
VTEPTTPLAVSMGEPAGIGPDLLLRLYAERAELKLPPFIVYGNIGFLRQRSARLGLDLKIVATPHEQAATVFASTLPVIDIEGAVPDRPGEPSPLSARVVIEAISRATADTLRGTCRALVTAPIHKAVLYGAGFGFPGHTEFLAVLCANGGTPKLPVMMLAHEDLRVVPLTVHVPLAQVPALITTELINTTVRTLAHDLRLRFGIAEPRLALTGLNPHSGEGGKMGTEELDVIGPAITGLQQEGFAVEGPIPADTVFHPPHWRRYDAVVAMYHDQALIPIKAVAFKGAVNVTLGLPIVRTSPDHGTAFDIAGTGKGSTWSFLAAMRLADTLTGGGA